MSRKQFGLGYEKGKADTLAYVAKLPPKEVIIEVPKKVTLGTMITHTVATEVGHTLGTLLINKFFKRK